MPSPRLQPSAWVLNSRFGAAATAAPVRAADARPRPVPGFSRRGAVPALSRRGPGPRRGPFRTDRGGSRDRRFKAPGFAGGGWLESPRPVPGHSIRERRFKAPGLAESGEQAARAWVGWRNAKVLPAFSKAAGFGAAPQGLGVARGAAPAFPYTKKGGTYVPLLGQHKSRCPRAWNKNVYNNGANRCTRIRGSVQERGILVHPDNNGKPHKYWLFSILVHFWISSGGLATWPLSFSRVFCYNKVLHPQDDLRFI